VILPMTLRISVEHVHNSSKPPLLAQVSETRDHKTFAYSSGHLYWNTIINEDNCSLMVNNTHDLVPLLKGIKLYR
jgi:hypothetical protein